MSNYSNFVTRKYLTFLTPYKKHVLFHLCSVCTVSSCVFWIG